MVLRLMSGSPVTGLFCHRRLADIVLSKPGWVDLNSANLTPASGRQDHTILPSAKSVSRQHAGDRSRVFRLALQSHRAQNAAASTATHPAFVTIMIRASCGVGWRKFVEMICPTGEAKYFCNEDWTTQISLRKHNKSPRTRNDIDGYRFRSTHPKRCPTGKSPLSGERTFLVSRTRRSAISAFTRVYDALWRCAAGPGPNLGVTLLIQIGRPMSALELQNRLKSDIAPGPKKRQNATSA